VKLTNAMRACNIIIIYLIQEALVKRDTIKAILNGLIYQKYRSPTL